MNAPHPAGSLAPSATDGFVYVAETILPGGTVVPQFRVSQYVCAEGEGGRAIVSADLAPWVRIDFREAQAACGKAGWKLITETQWLALAYQIAAQDENWTGGKVGKGKLFQGLRKGNVSSAQPGTYKPVDPDERRWFALPSGERLYDVAGNVFQWVFDDVQDNKNGLIAKPFKANSPSLAIPYPADEKGQGWTPRVGTDWSGHALIRGGIWYSESNAGVFCLVGVWPVSRGGNVGFRCTLP